MMRAAAKGLMEGAAWLVASAGILRARTGAATILAYHNILPHGERPAGERSLHLPRRRFAEQLDLLQETYQIVPITEILSPAESFIGPRLAITFDDAYVGTLTQGVEELAGRCLPATIFVPPGLLGGQAFWWDALADTTTGDLRTDVRETVLRELGGRTDRVRGWAAAQGIALQTLPEYCLSATEDALREAIRIPGITLGSHAWTHADLTCLEDEAVVDELRRPLDWLRERFPNAGVPWLAYPYGRWTPRVAALARAVGYEAGLRIGGGAVAGVPPDRTILPRRNVPAGITARGLVLRVAGFGWRS